MGVSTPPSPAAEAVATGAEGSDEEVQLPETISEAAQRAREIIAAVHAGEHVDGAEEGAAAEGEGAQETEEERVAREAAETPEQKEEREAAAKALIIEGPGLRGDDGNDAPFSIEVADEESAQVLRTWVKGYQRAEEARAVVEQGEALVAQANDIKYGVQMDPAGFVADVIKDDVPTQDHLFRILATRPGVLQRHSDWLNGLLDTPEAIAAEAQVADAERITRKEKITAEIQDKRAMDQNARALLRTMDKTVETGVPKEWGEEARAQFKQDVLSDLRVYARVKELRTVDPRIIPDLAARRLKLMGISATTAKTTAPTVTRPAAAKPAAPKIVTGADLVKGRQAKKAAASAPPGAGSPVGALLQRPPYDPKKPGNAIQQAAAWGRTIVSAMTKRPQ